MKVRHAACAVLLFSLSPLSAGWAAEPPKLTPEQQAMMTAWENAARLGSEHKLLAEHLVGTWKTQQSVWMDEKAPPQVSSGRSVHTAILGGRQIRIDFTGELDGTPFEGTGLMGYDNVGKRYVATWTDNMATDIVVGQGKYDAASRTYTLQNRMSDPLHPGQQSTMREVLKVVDANHLVQEMFEARGGKEARTLRIEYTREQ